LNDRKIRRAALKSLMNYRYEADPEVPKEECGKYNLKVNITDGLN